MLANYNDIKKRIKEQPKWFDCHGVPRYDDFHPSLSPNIYADEVVLMRIACQNCGRDFLVELNFSKMDVVFRATPLKERIESKLIHYGDPPNDDCCDSGPTMNCDDLEIVEYWSRKGVLEWKRDKKFEIRLL